jgi:hypothetical protein
MRTVLRVTAYRFQSRDREKWVYEIVVVDVTRSSSRKLVCSIRKLQITRHLVQNAALE